MVITYSMAYTEVLELLKCYLTEKEFNKIPKEKIKFFEENKDKNYKYEIDKKLPLEKQYISKEANSIIITLYRDYFINEKQKEILNEILKTNEKKYQKELLNNNVENALKEESDFKNKKIEIKEEKSLIEVKEEKWYKKIYKFIWNFFKKKKS